MSLYLMAQADRHELKRSSQAYIDAKARAIAEYRLPLPGSGIKLTDIDDGRWFSRLSDNEKANIFQPQKCAAVYAGISCQHLRQYLTDLYADSANLRIPYAEALYIASQRDKGSDPERIKVEIAVARDTMHEYYDLIDKPSLYLKYDSLQALRNDIAYNALKKDRIIKPLTAKDSPLVTIKSAKVQSVMKNSQWPGVIVMTYALLEGKTLYGVVYIHPDDLADTKTHNFVEGLKRDDSVQIVGSAYSFETRKYGALPSEAIRFAGDVYPLADGSIATAR